MAKVLVTGGNGFLGSALVSALCDLGAEVHSLARHNVHRLQHILPSNQIHLMGENPYEASAVVTSVQPETIFHLAAVYEEPEQIGCIESMINGNVALGTALLWGASHCEQRVNFVNTGTYWQFSEVGSYAPNTLYAATKQAFQDLLQFYQQKHFVSAMTLVLYDTFGPGDERNKLWSRLTRMRRGESIGLSDGSQTIELVHLHDVVQGFILAASLLGTNQRLDSRYALTAQNPSTLRTMVEALNDGADLGIVLNWGARPSWPGQVTTPWIGQRLPGWEPRVDVLQAMIDSAIEGRKQMEMKNA